MSKFHAQILLAGVFCALTAFAMWLGWPWVVGFALFFTFMVFA